MTNLKDLAPESCSLSVLDAEARAIVDKFEELFSEAPPPSAPRAPQPALDEFAIEFPDDDPSGMRAAAAPSPARGGRREPVLAPPEKWPLKDRKPDGLRLKPFELPRAAAAAESDGSLPMSAKRQLLPDLPGSMDGRRKSTAIFAGIAVALLIGIGAGYIAGQRTDTAASAAKADSSPGIGQTLRFDYELTQRSQSGKKRDPAR